jgi:transcription initiation factor TFIIB
MGMMLKPQKNFNDLCPECKSKYIIIDTRSGEQLCGNCGLVLTENLINQDPEWRAFSQDETNSRSRVGMPLSFFIHDKGLSTSIGQVRKDAFGRTIPTKTMFQMLRLKKWHFRSSHKSNINRNLSHAMTELSKLSDKLYIPKQAKERAAVIYRKALYKDLIRGRSISAITAASLYTACRITKTPRTLNELAYHSTIEKKDLARCYRLLLRELNLHMPIPKAQFRVPKIAAKINIGERTQQTAVSILRRAEDLKTTAGKDPMGLAAAAIYIACILNHEKRTQKMIADAAGVTEVTIRNRYKGLKEELNLKL